LAPMKDRFRFGPCESNDQ